MRSSFSVGQFLVLLTLVGGSFYAYIGRENALTQAELQLAPVAREVAEIEEQNATLRYQLSRFEAPSHLFRLASEAPYGHLGLTESTAVALAEEKPWVKESPQGEAAASSSAMQPRIAASAR